MVKAIKVASQNYFIMADFQHNKINKAERSRNDPGQFYRYFLLILNILKYSRYVRINYQ